MALKQSNMVKRITASGGGQLEADAGESFRIKAIFVDPSSNDDWLTVTIDRVTVGYYKVGARGGNNLCGITPSRFGWNLMEVLNNAGINVSLPVAEGQTIAFSRYDETGEINVVYDKYDAADVRANQQNGSESDDYIFMQYLGTSKSPSGAGEFLLDKSLSPAEFVDFPATGGVPSGRVIKCHGIFGCPVATANSSDNGWYSKLVKLVKDREVLLDEDRNGLLFEGDSSVGTSTTKYDDVTSVIGGGVDENIADGSGLMSKPLLFSQPIEFSPGEELGVYLNAGAVGTWNWTSDLVDLALILEVTGR